MKLEHLLFLVLVLLAALFGYLSLQEQPVHAQGVAHPDHPAMALGGDAASRSLPILGAGLAFALLQVTFFGGLLLLGLRRGDHERVFPRYLPVAGALALLALAFVLLFVSYRGQAVAGADVPTVLGFPPATAWMLYGVWWTPLALVALYVWRFDDWVYGDWEQARFAELVAAARQADETAARESAQSAEQS